MHQNEEPTARLKVHPSPILIYLYGLLFLILLVICFLLFKESLFFDSIWRIFIVSGVLWLFYHYLSHISSVYEINPLEISIEVGIFSKSRAAAPLNRITNFELRRSLLERIFGLANLLIDTAGSSDVEVGLHSMRLSDAENFAKVLSLNLGQQKIIDAGEDKQLREDRVEAVKDIVDN